MKAQYRFLVLLLIAAEPNHAFVPSRTRRILPSFSSTARKMPDLDEKEEMKKSIEAMKQEARKRLKTLSKELSELELDIGHNGKENQQLKVQSTPHHHKEHQKQPASTPPSHDRTMEIFGHDVPRSSLSDKVQEAGKHDPKEEKRLDLIKEPIRIPHADVDLLVDTRWKIVFNLGREPGTWMPPSWGASGERLRWSLVVELTNETFYEKEEFLEGRGSEARVLKVVEANLGPTFFDSEYHCQIQLKVSPRGAYKVIRGAGPSGTDVLRFFVETNQEIKASDKSDISCPEGRIYGNCGYFPIYSTLDASSSGTSSGDHYPHAHHTHWKEILQQEYNLVAAEYDQLQRENEEDERLFSVEQLGRFSRIAQLRNTLKRLENRIHEAKQREPEKSQLRLSRTGDVGLSREGGVCLKVHKGVNIEYHILGRMELANEKKPLGPDLHEDFEALKHKLHP